MSPAIVAVLGYACGRQRRHIFITEAAAEIFAKLKARMARLPGEVVEAFAMDKERASKVPERMLGKIRSAHEADELLDRME